MHATLSFLGLYNFDGTLFDSLQVPDTLDKEDVINNLLLDTAELEVMISSADIMRDALGMYSKRRLPMWPRAAAAYAAQYQLVQTITADEPRTPNLTTTENETRTPNLTTTGENNGNDTTTTSRTGFNSDDLERAEQVQTQLGTGNTIHSTGTETSEKSSVNSGTETTEKTHTDTGPMMERIINQLELAKRDAIGYIVNDIKRQFCLLVY